MELPAELADVAHAQRRHACGANLDLARRQPWEGRSGERRRGHARESSRDAVRRSPGFHETPSQSSIRTEPFVGARSRASAGHGRGRTPRSPGRNAADEAG